MRATAYPPLTKPFAAANHLDRLPPVGLQLDPETDRAVASDMVSHHWWCRRFACGGHQASRGVGGRRPIGMGTPVGAAVATPAPEVGETAGRWRRLWRRLGRLRCLLVMLPSTKEVIVAADVGKWAPWLAAPAAPAQAATARCVCTTWSKFAWRRRRHGGKLRGVAAVPARAWCRWARRRGTRITRTALPIYCAKQAATICRGLTRDMQRSTARGRAGSGKHGRTKAAARLYETRLGPEPQHAR